MSIIQCQCLSSKHHQLSLVALQVPTTCPSYGVLSIPKYRQLSLAALQVLTTCPSFSVTVYYQNIASCPLSLYRSLQHVCHSVSPFIIKTSPFVHCSSPGPYNISVIQCHCLSSKHHPLSTVALQVSTTCPSFSAIIYYQNITNCPW